MIKVKYPVLVITNAEEVEESEELGTQVDKELQFMPNTIYIPTHCTLRVSESPLYAGCAVIYVDEVDCYCVKAHPSEIEKLIDKELKREREGLLGGMRNG